MAQSTHRPEDLIALILGQYGFSLMSHMSNMYRGSEPFEGTRNLLRGTYIAAQRAAWVIACLRLSPFGRVGATPRCQSRCRCGGGACKGLALVLLRAPLSLHDVTFLSLLPANVTMNLYSRFPLQRRKGPQGRPVAQSWSAKCHAAASRRSLGCKCAVDGGSRPDCPGL